VFRSRATSEKSRAADQAQETSKKIRDPQAPKGRPTPKRSVAQSQRRSVTNKPKTRKDAMRQQREERRVQMERQRAGLASGDERFLPARDKGPVKRFVRDWVDSRLHVTELFLPIAVVIMIMSMLPNNSLKAVALMLWIFVMVVMVLEITINGFRMRGELRKRFPDGNLRGAVRYGILRAMQVRRLRLPKPQVKRGERP
jgi:Protein of unknown function (DUF3043)